MIRYKDFECDTVEEAVALMRAMSNRMVMQADDGWITWGGGECPVPGDTRVQILFRCETTDDFDDAVNCASDYDWQHSDDPHDIVKYRIVS